MVHRVHHVSWQCLGYWASAGLCEASHPGDLTMWILIPYRKAVLEGRLPHVKLWFSYQSVVGCGIPVTWTCWSREGTKETLHFSSSSLVLSKSMHRPKPSTPEGFLGIQNLRAEPGFNTIPA